MPIWGRNEMPEDDRAATRWLLMQKPQSFYVNYGENGDKARFWYNTATYSSYVAIGTALAIISEISYATYAHPEYLEGILRSDDEYLALRNYAIGEIGLLLACATAALIATKVFTGIKSK